MKVQIPDAEAATFAAQLGTDEYRKEERDYRSLERESMYSIFGPLDEQEPPERPRKRKRLLTLPFIPYLDDTTWTVVLTRLAEDR